MERLNGVIRDWYFVLFAALLGASARVAAMKDYTVKSVASATIFSIYASILVYLILFEFSNILFTTKLAITMIAAYKGKQIVDAIFDRFVSFVKTVKIIAKGIVSDSDFDKR